MASIRCDEGAIVLSSELLAKRLQRGNRADLNRREMIDL